ncbi:MAG: peptide chain release factor N(5)-glutamine methyltransferase [Ignavibacterium sp.]|nr:peptide chain release factor N(5)-glutamine methyltransferase [Ignavibacterium sp.]MDW8376135.1 peptide chain release factor N(5)-glutamine methyltransferase [Ignavibacteriales bacterium]
MITVLEAINLSTEYLQKKGVESPRLNAELMLAHILNCKRLNLYLMFDRPLNENELTTYREFLARRGKREPLQYILGKTEFYNVTLKTDSRALIPRPETELLVETIINLYKNQNSLNFLDIGVGSGCITIALLKNLFDSKATAVDVSEDSLSLTKENLKSNNLEHKCSLIKFNVLEDDYSKLGKFDFVVSNPPYVSKSEFENLQPELKNFEPRIALTDNYDGLKFYKAIIQKADKILNSGGKLFFEISPSVAKEVEELFYENDFININLIKDFNNHFRIIYGERK